MAQFDHALPDGTVVQAIDAETAQPYLRRMVWSFMEGSEDNWLIGNQDRLQAVVMNPGLWLEAIALQDRRSQTGAEAFARKLLADAENQWQSGEHLSALLKAGPAEISDDIAPPVQQLRVAAVDVQIAAEQLIEVASALDAEIIQLLILGEGGVARGVLMSAELWMGYLDIEAEAAGEERIFKIVRERLATPLEDCVEFDEFLDEFKEFDEGDRDRRD